jgi:GH25 family lysozyme M1 (1,4-beta-N-acetylmuramidase)
MSDWLVLDVSKFNAISDYASAAGDVDGVIMRVGYRGYGSAGTLTEDSLFSTHYSGFSGKGIKIGYYFFSQAITEAEAIAEADYVAGKISGKTCDFPIYIDSEYSNSDHDGRADSLSKADRTTMVVAFCERIKELGYKAGVYASDSWFISQLDWSIIGAKDYSIWDASYSAAPSRVDHYDGWQYTSSGTVSGYSGNVDLSHFYVDVAGWEDNTTKDISSMTANLQYTTVVYDGSAKTPTVSISGLTSGTDFTVSYSSNTNVGTATVIITGSGNYTGTINKTFTITAKNISSESFSLATTSYTYDGSAKSPSVSTSVSSSYYSVSYSNNTNAGTGIVTITGKGNYTGTKTLNFTINPANLSNSTISCGETNEDGCYNLDNLTVTYGSTTLKEDTDYTKNITHTKDGVITVSTVSITGKGNYTGTNSATFNSDKELIEISTLNPKTKTSSFVYTGSAQTPEIIFDESLTKDTDYTVEYSNNTNKGTAKATITGKGDYTGTVDVSFTITSADISKAVLSCGEADEKGNYSLGNFKVTYNDTDLVYNKDYLKTQVINSPSSMKMVVNGIGNYTGTNSKVFQIDMSPFIDFDITTYKFTLSSDELEYTGEELKPEVVCDSEMVTYEVSYKDNIDAGTGKITITGTGFYKGTVEKEFTINPTNIAPLRIDIDDPDENGNYDLSTIKVTKDDGETYLELSVDYNVDFSETYYNKQYIITNAKIIGIGNYTSIYSQSFQTSIDPNIMFDGKEVYLNICNIYTRYHSEKATSTKTGTYYVWSDIEKNGRVRVTQNKEFVGIPGQVTGWVNVSDLITKTDISVGDKVIVNGMINTYADGTGNKIAKNSEIMYVVDILDKNLFDNYIGVASAPNRTRQGWGNTDIIKIYKE